MKNFIESHKVDIALFDTTGSTAEKVTPLYYDMRGYDHIDFLISAGNGPGSTVTGTLTARILQAPTATNPATVIPVSSATVSGGAATSYQVSGAAVLGLVFTTLASGATFSVNGLQFSFDSTAIATANVINSTGATAQATVASEAFVTQFNSSNCTLSPYFVASTEDGATVLIRPKDPGSTTLTATGTTLVAPRAKTMGLHVGMDVDKMSTNNRYVGVGVKSTGAAMPFTVMVVRSKASYGLESQKGLTASNSMGSTAW
jgi:hypothetical protein